MFVVVPYSDPKQTCLLRVKIKEQKDAGYSTHERRKHSLATSFQTAIPESSRTHAELYSGHVVVICNES